MDLWTTIWILFRRWYVTIPVLACSAAASAYVVSSMASEYQATASMVVLAPAVHITNGTVDKNTKSNPYLLFGGSQDVVATVLQTIMESDTARQGLKEQGVLGDWSLAASIGNGPVLHLSVTEKTAQGAVSSAQKILDAAKKNLADLQTQAGSPPDQLIGVSVISAPTRARLLLGSKIRVAAGLGAVGIGLTFGAAFAFESLARGRRARKARKAELVALSLGPDTREPRHLPRVTPPAPPPSTGPPELVEAHNSPAGLSDGL